MEDKFHGSIEAIRGTEVGMPRPSSTQIGSIGVNHVANALMISSGGRLSVFWPVADDDGIDLLVYDKVSGQALPTQVKSRTVTLKKRGSSERGNVVHFEIRKATYRSDRYACAVFVLLSADASSIERTWVIPMQDLPTCAISQEKKYVIRPSKALASEDRCSGYRCNDWRAIGIKVQELIDELAPTTRKKIRKQR